MHAKKLENLLKMPGQDRFGYFVRKVADFKEVWGLFENGWAMGADDQGQKAILFWPEKEFAEAYATGMFAGHHAKQIALDAFLERWIPGMIADKHLAAIFPTPVGQAVFVTPETLLGAIEEESEGLEE